MVDLLDELRRDMGLTLVFIAHDLAVVRRVSDGVAVMSAGRIVAQGTVDEVYDTTAPVHQGPVVGGAPHRPRLDAGLVRDPRPALNGTDRRRRRRWRGAREASRLRYRVGVPLIFRTVTHVGL
ncbi:ABC-type multidrug transport system ATPase subunit [Embleya sp. AB8]